MTVYGLLMMQREINADGRELARIVQADDTALISPILVGQAFADESPYLRIDGRYLTISDDFGRAVVYRIGEYVMDGDHGFALRREDRTRYESHVWSPRTDGDDECVVCGVTWQDCDDECPGVPS